MKSIIKHSERTYSVEGGSQINSTILGNAIHNATGKTTPVDADELPISDSAASWILKKVTWSNIKATLKTYFDTIYQAALGYTPVNKAGDNLTGAVNANKGTDIASASTTNIGAAIGEFIHITGTTTITAFDTVQAGTMRALVFDDVLTLTHNATSLILPDSSNIITAAGDTAIFRSEGSGNWKCILYNRASGVYSSWSPSFTGFSANPTNVKTRYFLIGKMCHFWINMSGGTSNATTTTVTLPFNANSSAVQIMNTFIIQNSGTVATAPGRIDTRVGSNIADVYRDALKSAWTASGTKAFFGYGVYEID